ncbi:MULTISPECIES: magnesium-translocating P-type ATPase [Mesorhizobium]|uniref:Magnesium-transporting ATPase, P-type 1 n=2 Tax=Mesorhizobium TaxID=68287 RepID=A0A1A5HS24_RHILI|nr:MULTISPECIES: magnesium-translocating P-type ATPase [Mesorhizobium]ETA71269.1 magnesium-translocating P-type ATPase [Mesorhizobium japonicum R7A]OBP69541.1 magnesium-translocating P-type ATPase [Mesorhizobium loti]OBP72463.1 magnesium-translocating P-type ATPase [Mesorhizobium loti]OBP76377.1 magnesium-translocating P-type ATPase [Mesorhizobium loti]OBP84348.1 magnesium-translocating P-type ATPase [Mesorhizobium loti]
MIGEAGQQSVSPQDGAYWSIETNDLLLRLETSVSGLASSEAASRLAKFGRNTLASTSSASALAVFARQFRSPLVLILIFAACVSAFVGDGQEAAIIGAIVLASCVLSFTQEYGASRATEALKQRISRKAIVLRDGAECSVAAEDIVPGDVIRLSAGNLIPVDGIILDARDFNVSEAVLTGETFPAVKTPGRSAPDAALTLRTNAVFTGTSVRSGTATVLAAATGTRTEFASIAAALERQIPETGFARGIRLFGYLMTEIMLAIVILVFFANLMLHRPLIESMLFSLALAVGLTPELLPAIISVTLARGARAMAANGVIVRRLDAIENLGSMDLLCTDKTGTLTEGVIHLDGWLDVDGNPSTDILLWGRLNATLQTGLKNPLDEAIAGAPREGASLAAFTKVDEIPYDFIRKRLSVVVRDKDAQNLLITKGAVQNVLETCSFVRTAKGLEPLNEMHRAAIDEKFRRWSADGYRVLGLAIRRFESQKTFSRKDEIELAFAGFLLFLDPPKKGVKETLAELAQRGITVKVISGDNRYVAAHLAQAIGLRADRIMTGEELSKLTKSALFAGVQHTDLFVEIDPNQKERIVQALRSRGRVVGYLGDGINDAPALHEADIGISVDSAVDVAREAADIILLKQDLGVLVRGVDDGRKTFANTMKYISITTSANFGNMISMAVASLFLPFLPLLAKQILLNNFLSDVPSLAIASDNVDPDQLHRPRHWDIRFVRRFMISFGLVSSLFDFATFTFLLFFAHAAEAAFQTAWFVESLLTELAIVLIVRTHRVFWASRPSPLLAWLTLAVGIIAIMIPYLPFAAWFGFVPLPLPVLAGLVAITALYLLTSEATKRWFFGQERRARKKLLAGQRSFLDRLVAKV